MAVILTSEIKKRNFEALKARIPNTYTGADRDRAEVRAKMCAGCNMYSPVATECIKCDCSFSKGFFKLESTCPLKYWRI